MKRHENYYDESFSLSLALESGRLRTKQGPCRLSACKVNETVNFDYTNKQISASFETFSIHVPYIRFLADIWDVKYYLD